MSITKEQVSNNLEDVKKYVQEIENIKEEKTIGIEIKNRWTGSIIFKSTKTTYKEAVEEAYLSKADLSGAYLSKADLSGADLSGAYLSKADLSEADLSGADLSKADLSEADLRGAELNYAKFYGRGGTVKIKKENLSGFLEALGFILEN